MTAKNKENNNKSSMGIIEHLTELRKRLIISLIALLSGFLIAYQFSGPMLEFLVRPLLNALPPGHTLITTGLPEGFIVHLKLGLLGGFLLSAPIIFYQLWAFIAPGLYAHEKKFILPLAILGSLLFFAGCALAYTLAFPLAFKFFISFTGAWLQILPSLSQYISLVTAGLLSFGLVFQMPLVLLFLNKIGLIKIEHLKKGRKYAILLIFILAAILTPPDVISQLMMAFPMLILYELSLILIYFIGRQPKN